MPASVPPRSEGHASFGLVLTFYQRDPAYALGLAAISAHAKHVHPDVRVHLVPIMRDDPVAQVVDEVGALAPNLIGVSAMAPTWLPSDPYLRALKAAYPDVPICVGGYQAIVSPDETLAHAAVDVSGRPYCVHTGEPDHLQHTTIAGSSVPYHTVINRHVFESLAMNARIALHVRVLYGRDPHHITEAQYKAVARALRQAVELDPRLSGVPSTKGVL